MSTAALPTAGFRKGRLILLALVPGVLLVDMLNGLTGGARELAGIPSPAEAIRGPIILFALLVFARAVHPGLRRLQGWILLLAALGSLGMLYVFFRGGGLDELLDNLSLLLKVLYGPLLLLLLVVVIRRYQIDITEVLDAVAWVAGLGGGSIVMLALTGIGQPTYVVQDIGAKGLFIAQNDVGLAMGIGLVACMDMLLRTGRVRYAVIGLLGLAGMLMLGTRAAMVAAFAVPAVMLMNYWGPLFRDRRRVFIGILVGLTLLGSLTAAGLWRYRSIEAEPFQQQKLQTLTDTPFVRGMRVLGAYEYVRHRPGLAKLIGEGSVNYSRGLSRNLRENREGVLAEVDWMDMFGIYGIFFAIAIYMFYFECFSHTRDLRTRYGITTVRTAMLALGWFLIHSVVAGHAVAGTIPAGTLAPLLALAWSERKSLRGA